MTAYDYLLALPRFTEQGAAAYRPGLERMDRLMEGMGNPHRAFRSVHVAGTNGKGSTASFLAAIATAAGLRSGLHTSPHLFDLGERMRVDGEPAPAIWIEDAVARHRPLLDKIRPSFFEATVALSFLYFEERRVDVAIVEVGLGGRLDATNIISPALGAITNIGLEHTDLLGGTLPAIAREKAGIIKPGIPVLTTVASSEALDVITAVADKRAAPLHIIQQEVGVTDVSDQPAGLRLNLKTPLRHYEGLEIGLGGRYQVWNAALALRAAELLFEEVRRDAAAVYAGLRQVKVLSGIRGRLDVLRQEPLIIADVGHNADGLEAALSAVTPTVAARAGALYVIFGAMRDKDIPRMAALLAGADANVLAACAGGERALPAEELAGMLTYHSVAVAGSGQVEDGLQWYDRQAGPRDVLLVTGSHQIIAQIPQRMFSDEPDREKHSGSEGAEL